MKWRHIFLTGITILSSVSSVYAKVEINDNPDTGMITVYGYMDGYEESNIISFDVKSDDGDIVHTTYIPTSDGNFEYTFMLPDVTEEYVFTFSSYGNKEEVLYTSVSTADAEGLVGMINDVAPDDNSNSDENKIIDIIENNTDAFSVNSYFWNNVFGKKEKTFIAKAILQNKKTGYQSLDEIRSIAVKEYAIRSFAACVNGSDVKKAEDEFADIYNLEENTSKFSEFNELTDSKKEILNTIVSNEIKNTVSVETLEDIYEIVDRGMLLALINNATDPGTIKKLMDENCDYMTFETEIYTSGNRSAICSYLFGKDIYSMEELEKMIKKSTENNKKPSSSGGGGGGGGKTSSASDVVQYPVSQAPAEKKSGFDDIGDALWAEDAILYLADKKIINGVGDNKFAPNDNVTREQFVQMLVKAFELSGEGSPGFQDVPEEHWAYDAISVAVSNGITGGIGNSMFGVGQNITRQDMAVMAQKVIAGKGYTLSSVKITEFADYDNIADYAKDSVKFLSEAGVINGFEDNTFKPQGVATRAQAAKIIYTILQAVK